MDIRHLRYKAEIITWAVDESNSYDRKTWKLFSTYSIVRPISDTEKLYVSRKSGVRRHWIGT